MWKKLPAACIAIIFTACAIADENAIELKIKDDGDFDILLHRAESTATGAVIGGLIGAGIEEGVRSSKDSSKKKQILEKIEKPSCKDKLYSSLLKKLQTSGYTINTLTEETKTDTIIEIEISNCGFKLSDSDTRKLSAFIDFKATLLNGSDKPIKHKFFFFGKEKYSFNELLEDGSATEKILHKVLKKAGKRLANKILYTRKG